MTLAVPLRRAHHATPDRRQVSGDSSAGFHHHHHHHHHRTRTVVVLGCSYGGSRAARLLVDGLPPGWRVVVIDRNSHMNHVYVFPRFSVLAEHAPKGFIPYSNLLVPTSSKAPRTADTTDAECTQAKPKIPTSGFSRPPSPPDSPKLWPLHTAPSTSLDTKHEFIQGTLASLHAHHLTVTRPSPRPCDTASSPGACCRIGEPRSTLPGWLASQNFAREMEGWESRRSSSRPGTPALSRKSSTGSLIFTATTGPVGMFDGPEETIEFDYCVYALGSGMPDPVNVWREHPNLPIGDREERERGLGGKRCGIRWLEGKSRDLKKAKSIVVVGGGALGIQFATDLKDLYPDKHVTLLHSRAQLMPLYPMSVHVAVMDAMQRLGVDVVLGERVLVWPDEPEHLDGKPKKIVTTSGREFEADLVLPCTGQKPHVSFMAALAPACISPVNSRIRVSPSMQISPDPDHPIRKSSTDSDQLEKLATLHLHQLPTPPSSRESSDGSSTLSDIPEGYSTAPSSWPSNTDDAINEDVPEDLSHIFAIGDCADTGAIQAGHTAYYQAEVAARNILRLVKGDGEELEGYTPGAPAIKVSLGIKENVVANGDVVEIKHDGVEDLRALTMWPLFNAQDMSVES